MSFLLWLWAREVGKRKINPAAPPEGTNFPRVYIQLILRAASRSSAAAAAEKGTRDFGALTALWNIYFGINDGQADREREKRVLFFVLGDFPLGEGGGGVEKRETHTQRKTTRHWQVGKNLIIRVVSSTEIDIIYTVKIN